MNDYKPIIEFLQKQPLFLKNEIVKLFKHPVCLKRTFRKINDYKISKQISIEKFEDIIVILSSIKPEFGERIDISKFFDYNLIWSMTPQGSVFWTGVDTRTKIFKMTIDTPDGERSCKFELNKYYLMIATIEKQYSIENIDERDLKITDENNKSWG